MKSRFVLLAIVCAASLSVGSAAAQAIFTQLKGLEYFTGIVEGVVNCQHGVTPTGIPNNPCGDGVRGTIRGRQITALEFFSDPRFNGVATIVSNINFDRNGAGQTWGTFEVFLDIDDGVIEGTYTGTVDFNTGALDLELVGHGQGGIAEGLQLKADDVHLSPPPSPGTLFVRLLSPGGKH